MNWQPIGTFPKSEAGRFGGEVLIYVPGRERSEIVIAGYFMWADGCREEFCLPEDGADIPIEDVTHWMPLPEKP